MTDRDLTPLGQLLERARVDVLKLSGREAARRAGISGSRWHQVVTGRQPKGGRLVPVNPRPLTVVAMALAVRVDPAEALRAANIQASPESVQSLVEEVQHPPSSSSRSRGDELADEIERIRDLPIAAAARRRMIEALVSVAEEAAAEERDTRSRTG